MPKIELLNCPFCGGKAERVLCQDRDEYGSLIGFPFWAVKCKSCAAEIWNPEEQDGLEPDKMIEVAAKAWNTRASDWIPCSERMPEDGKRILIYVHLASHESVQLDTCIEDGGYMYLDSGYSFGKEVTHWMQLPDPPKEDAE